MSTKYRVQYKANDGEWNNVDRGTLSIATARNVLLEEARVDPEYDHRIIAQVYTETVVSLIAGNASEEDA